MIDSNKVVISTYNGELDVSRKILKNFFACFLSAIKTNLAVKLFSFSFDSCLVPSLLSNSKVTHILGV